MFSKARNTAAWQQSNPPGRGPKLSGPVRLTPRQREVLALLCEGLPNKVICRRLSISAGTAKAHISTILRELGVTSRLQAVVAAHRLELVTEDDETSEEERASSRGGMVLHIVELDTSTRQIRPSTLLSPMET